MDEQKIIYLRNIEHYLVEELLKTHSAEELREDFQGFPSYEEEKSMDSKQRSEVKVKSPEKYETTLKNWARRKLYSCKKFWPAPTDNFGEATGFPIFAGNVPLEEYEEIYKYPNGRQEIKTRRRIVEGDLRRSLIEYCQKTYALTSEEQKEARQNLEII